MTHVDAGTIAALRDELTPDAPAYAHVRTCSACVAALAEASARAAHIADGLAALDVPVDLAAAKVKTRARLDRTRTQAHGARWRSWPLGRAAVLLALGAGAASALTWMPLRNLWPVREATPAVEPAVAPTTEPTPVQLPSTSGISVDVAGGAIDVIVRGAQPGATLQVLWASGTTARVAGPAGTGFTYGEGRLQVDATPGDLLLELPRGARSTVVVDGRVVLERSADGVTASARVLARTDDLVTLEIGAR